MFPLSEPSTFIQQLSIVHIIIHNFLWTSEPRQRSVQNQFSVQCTVIWGITYGRLIYYALRTPALFIINCVLVGLLVQIYILRPKTRLIMYGVLVLYAFNAPAAFMLQAVCIGFLVRLCPQGA